MVRVLFLLFVMRLLYHPVAIMSRDAEPSCELLAAPTPGVYVGSGALIALRVLQAPLVSP